MNPPEPTTTAKATLQTPAEPPDEGELTLLLTAWDLAHPSLSDPEWRHLLDELAHPRTTRAFQHLADTKA
ncbi:hypothetical protein [Streptomyces gilvus]|uniref:hypothetical protein n=1 Tax=Streptomyces gilvus TaxID=2920937 RepID=UPI001F0D4599|nr:hypothetical protein [Streptomyces sp. CME 23]MCH5677655.1 hypothetical protein [Streptomyces sp. CME 23]